MIVHFPERAANPFRVEMCLEYLPAFEAGLRCNFRLAMAVSDENDALISTTRSFVLPSTPALVAGKTGRSTVEAYKSIEGGSMTRSIENIDHLEDLISQPTEGVIETLGKLDGDIIILGAAGKMGPSLARMAKRASEAAGVKRRVVGVSRFSNENAESELKSFGIETVKCDLLDVEQVERLPDAENVVYMAGMKFGTTNQEAATWAVNSYLPGVVCRKYRNSRIVAFSTGNVYGLSPVCLGGSVETDPPNPTGEYAMSALGRERIFEYFSRSFGIPTAIIRLNYAVEMRYGVLVDLARKVWSGEPIDLSMGAVNVIWQADANAMALQAFGNAGSPPFILNVAGPEQLSVHRVALEFAELMNREPVFMGTECSDAFLSNGQLGHRLYGYPRVSAQQMIQWIADWVMRGGESLGKPTHFENRQGKY